MKEKNIMPQEIEVWYLIPALRRELAKVFISKHGMSQKKAAETLKITEAAISQYLKAKRGKEINFSKKELKIIEKSAGNILENPKSLMKEIYDLTVEFRESKSICNLHRNHDSSVRKDCDVCFEN